MRVQIQPTTCQRSAMVKISENSPAGNKAKHLSSINNPAKTIHQCAQIRLILEVKFCFSTWVFFHEYSRFTGQLEKRDIISLSPLYHFHLVHRHLGISQEIIAENSILYLETWLWNIIHLIWGFYKDISQNPYCKGFIQCHL